MSQKVKRAVLCALHAACVLVSIPSSAPVFAGEMRRVVSDYAVTPEVGHGVIRAFFYGPNTVIEFENPPSSFSVVDEQGKPVEFESEGRFIRLIGRPSVFTAMFSGRAATFRTFVHVAKLSKPSVDELAKFDNFYAEKGKPLDLWSATPPTLAQPQQQQGAQAVIPAPVPTAPPATTPPVAPIESKRDSGLQTTQRARTTVKDDQMRVASTEVKESPSDMQKPGKDVSAAKPALAEEPDSRAWTITLADKSIRALLERWCREAGYQPLWEVTVDLEINATATITGTFEDAINSVLTSLSTSNYPIEALIYDNRVVRVVKHVARKQ